MHLDDVLFLTSISNYAYYGASNTVDNHEALTLEEELKNVIRSYTIRRFEVAVIFLDLQFKYIKDRNRLGASVIIVSKSECMK